MAKIRRRPGNQYDNEPRTCSPAWAWLTAGILIGIFISFLVYLREIEPYVQRQEKVPFPQMLSSNHSKTLPPVIEPETRQPEKDTEVRFDFTFYDKLESQSNAFDNQSNAFPADLAPSPHLPTSDTGIHILQVGSFTNPDEADSLKAHLALLGFHAYLEPAMVNGETWVRVRIGPFSDATTLQKVQYQLQNNDINAIILQF